MKKAGKISLGILLMIFVLSVSAPFITVHDPDKIDLDSLRESPSLEHPLGTDSKGRDILSRILYGGRISMSIAFAAAIISMAIGLLVGLISGYLGGRTDTILMAFVDLMLSFPSLLLAIGISVIFPSGIYTVMIAIAAVGWASFARVVRGHILSLRESSFVEAAVSAGCSRIRVMFVHLMPQCIPLIIVMMGMKIGGYIITEASLSFLGLGAQPPAATWGSMINANRTYITSAPWMVFAPGFMIAITALCFNILSDALRDTYGLDLRQKQ